MCSNFSTPTRFFLTGGGSRDPRTMQTFYRSRRTACGVCSVPSWRVLSLSGNGTGGARFTTPGGRPTDRVTTLWSYGFRNGRHRSHRSRVTRFVFARGINATNGGAPALTSARCAARACARLSLLFAGPRRRCPSRAVESKTLGPYLLWFSRFGDDRPPRRRSRKSTRAPHQPRRSKRPRRDP